MILRHAPGVYTLFSQMIWKKNSMTCIFYHPWRCKFSKAQLRILTVNQCILVNFVQLLDSWPVQQLTGDITSKCSVNEFIRSQCCQDLRYARMPDYWILRSVDCQIIRLLYCQIIRSIDCQINRSLDHQIVRSLNYQIFRLSDHQIIRLLDCQIVTCLNHLIARSLDLCIVSIVISLYCQFAKLLNHQIIRLLDH